MALVDRAQRIITSPQTEWPTIAIEPTTPSALFSGYVVPLALITPICSFVSYLAFAHRSLILAAVVAIVTFVLSLVSVFVLSLIADALAPSFNGVKDQTQALKWIAYSYTASWVAGIATLIPVVGALVALLGGLYSLYLLYLGAVPVMRVPAEKAAGFTIVMVIASIVLSILIGVAVGILVTIMAAGAIITSGGIH